MFGMFSRLIKFNGQQKLPVELVREVYDALSKVIGEIDWENASIIVFTPFGKGNCAA